MSSVDGVAAPPVVKRFKDPIPAERAHKIFRCSGCGSDVSETEFKPDRVTGILQIQCPRPGCHSRHLVFAGKWIGLDR